jgi:hypothetical protein
MARTTFSGPVRSQNGFEGNMVSGTVSSSSGSFTVLTSASGTVTNLLATTLTIGATKLTTGNAASGAVSAQLGFIPVMVGATTAYIALYQSITV